MINSIGSVILNFVIGLVNILLIPIDAIIDTLMPDISHLLTYISNMIDSVLTSTLLYIIDLTLIPKPVIVALCYYLIFKVVINLTVYSVKLAIRWYNQLKW